MTEHEEATRQDAEAEWSWDVEGARLMVLEAIDNAAHGLTDEGKLEITAALDALIAVAARSSEVAKLRAALEEVREALWRHIPTHIRSLRSRAISDAFDAADRALAPVQEPADG